jgi:hypothetical protein
MIDLSPYFTTLAGAASLVVLITGWVNTNVLKLEGWKAQVLSWVISVGLAFVGSWKNIGIFAEMDVLWTVLNGLCVGLVANGIYSADLVKTILEFVKAKPAKTVS